MVKEIVLIILLFNYGELSLPSFPFKGTVHECFEYGDKMRIDLATYNEERNVWFLKDGTGTWQGFICN
jgi:hypothetical protein|tara:strand:- start:201 stop:404 length:204 start_codon:yes stop_codon:yes gene_type:complete